MPPVTPADHTHAHAIGEKAAVGKGHDMTNKLFGIESAWNLFERTLAVVGSFMTKFVGGVTVQVVGGPQSDIRRIWYLTLSAAFGRLRNGVVSTYGDISYSAEWDITAKACQLEIVYSAAVVTGGVGVNRIAWDAFPVANTDPRVRFGILAPGDLVRDGALKPGDTYWTFIKRGPEQLTIGGALPDWMQRADGTADFLRVNAGKPNEYIVIDAGDSIPSWVGLPCETGERTVRAVTGGARMIGGAWDSGARGVGDVLREWPTGGAGNFSRFPYMVQGARGKNGSLVTVRDPWSRVNIRGSLTLPDDGRVITTAEKTDPTVQPPQPFVDGRARTSLVHLVSQALLNPCFLPPTLPCTAVRSPTGSGRYLYNPGEDNNKYSNVIELSKLVGTLRRSTVAEDTMGRTHDGLPADAATTTNVEGP